MKKVRSNVKAFKNTAVIIVEMPSLHNFTRKRDCMNSNPTDILLELFHTCVNKNDKTTLTRNEQQSYLNVLNIVS
jgi:hypothetical protein